MFRDIVSLLFKQNYNTIWVWVVFFLRFYLFLERGERREKERERNIRHVRDTLISCLSHASNWGPGLQPRHVRWQGTEPVTLRFAGRHSIHRVTRARASLVFSAPTNVMIGFLCIQVSVETLVFVSENQIDISVYLGQWILSLIYRWLISVCTGRLLDKSR